MAERWIMNRIGFVNFWVYDVEEFPFRNGKLLLRGSNGSGKSITTQSFIPYILDGDRQPTRLDPFGGKDRKMEYYLLGDPDSGKEESTGYLYLEFKKPESVQYRTIGIGLQAKKGSKMHTWGFCILDGQRVGRDFMLYKEVGGQNIPLEAKQLRERLGNRNIFAEKTSEYKAMVAKQIFDIDYEHISDFDQLMNILIKTRSSKLSSKENLKPDQLYAILNESLRTLSEEELRPMSETMNKIEELHMRIDDAVKVRNDVKHIAAEYDKYNRYMLWKKADAYLKAYEKTAAEKNEADQCRGNINASKDQLDEKTNREKTLKTILEDLKRERVTLDDKDIHNQLEKKENAEKKRKEEEAGLSESRERLGQKQEKRKKLYREKDAKFRLKEGLEYEIKKAAENLSEYEYTPPLHDSYMKGIKFDDSFWCQGSGCGREINNYKNRLIGIRDLIKDRDKSEEQTNLAEKKFDQVKRERDAAKSSLDTAEDMFNKQKDELIERFHIAAKSNSEFCIDNFDLNKIDTLIAKYEGLGSSSELMNLLSVKYSGCAGKIKGEILECNRKINLAKEEYDNAAAELEILKNTPEPVPERSEQRQQARKALAEAGISALPFYECIDFKKDIDDVQKALLEAELWDMGLLDALVVPFSQREKALSAIGKLSDCMVFAEDCGGENLFFDAVNGALQKEAKAVINSICGDKALLSAIKADGYYRNGILEGHSVSIAEARFVGAENRRKYRERQIAELAEKTAALLREYEKTKKDLDAVQRRAEKLEEEFHALSDTSDINAALDTFQEEERAFKIAEDKFNDAETEALSASREYSNCCGRVDKESADIPYAKSNEVYSEAINEIGEYYNDFQEVISKLRDKNDCVLQISRLEDDISNAEEEVDHGSYELSKIQKTIHECEEIIRLCDEFLNRPENVDIAKRADELNKYIEKTEKDLYDVKEQIALLKDNIERNSKELKKIEELYWNYQKTENTLEKYFKEECDLGFVINDKNLTVNQAAKHAVKLVSDAEKAKEIGTVQTGLTKVFSEYTANSSEYNPTMDYDCFEDSGSEYTRRRSVVNLTWLGKKLSPLQFAEEISDSIDNDSLLVREEEENMFKETLMDTVSKKLYERIADSKRWIDSMAVLMRGINTSMGLSFTLSWKPKKDSEDVLKFDELRRILGMSKELVSQSDFEKLSEHFRNKINTERRVIEEQGREVNYSDLIKNVLDYRNWFEFKIHWKNLSMDKFNELTISRFNTFSGGERALSLYIPLFAAVAAQYEKAGKSAPKILALDEAFAGVDESNISEMFSLLEKLELGYIMNSQALWGCYDTVPALEIAELCHEKESNIITVILYEWDGKKKTLA